MLNEKTFLRLVFLPCILALFPFPAFPQQWMFPIFPLGETAFLSPVSDKNTTSHEREKWDESYFCAFYSKHYHEIQNLIVWANERVLTVPIRNLKSRLPVVIQWTPVARYTSFSIRCAGIAKTISKKLSNNEARKFAFRILHEFNNLLFSNGFYMDTAGFVTGSILKRKFVPQTVIPMLLNC